MMFGIPGFGDKVQVRLFEEVKTVDEQYDIVDFGLQYKGENDEVQIDSLVVGGSFHSLKKACGQLDDKRAQQEANKKRLEELEAKEASVTTPVVTPEATPASETVAA